MRMQACDLYNISVIVTIRHYEIFIVTSRSDRQSNDCRMRLHDGHPAIGWADMSWADMSWADMSWADMSWAGMSWADRSWADRFWADMSWVDMSLADVLWGCVGQIG